MREKTAARRAQQDLAAREMGLPVRQSRGLAGQLQVAGNESEIARLPVIPATNEIQDPDTGEFTFMLDFSALDGDDPLG